ncbi:transmembrane protein 177 [Trichonephila clavata]|uniref:Transmembrane protein 177 n=1 Tax=Trichonephila clavata TaxID=2740835 RepID=A0A8X6H8I1_TRICU|nr:transmembrane protein 177 [Trichonephila clavata]
MSRLVSWFSTKSGKIFTRTCVTVTGLSIFGVQIAFHGPMQENFKEMFQVYEADKVKPLSSKVRSLVKDVLKDCSLKKEEKEKLRFFNVIGHDLFHTGGINSPWGGMIGIPYMFEDAKEINFGKLKLEGHDAIDWIVEGQDLIEALTLSDNAKKFGLMREIYSCNIWDIMDNAFISTGCFLFPGAFVMKLNKKNHTIEKLPLKIRVAFYILFYAVSYVFYRCLKDPLKHLSAKKYDKQAAVTGPDYLAGGIEFYQKILQRNKILRELLGTRGERMYDKEGNENYLLLLPMLPIRKRLEFLQDLEKDLKAVPA